MFIAVEPVDEAASWPPGARGIVEVPHGLAVASFGGVLVDERALGDAWPILAMSSLIVMPGMRAVNVAAWWRGSWMRSHRPPTSAGGREEEACRGLGQHRGGQGGGWADAAGSRGPPSGGGRHGGPAGGVPGVGGLVGGHVFDDTDDRDERNQDCDGAGRGRAVAKEGEGDDERGQRGPGEELDRAVPVPQQGQLESGAYDADPRQQAKPAAKRCCVVHNASWATMARARVVLGQGLTKLGQREIVGRIRTVLGHLAGPIRWRWRCRRPRRRR